ncbi:MAG: phosphoribosylanthranilate isomerase [Anaerolineaceae bacterium]|nr:phosphoribosylanthranilate isomerase [Anaerolineaceae bacterium]
MIIQIYTMQSVEEAQAAIDLGVNHIGLTPAEQGLPGEISYQKAREICESVGSRATKVALSVDDNLDEIVRMAQAVQPDILHLCALFGAVPSAKVRELRPMLPAGMRIMQAIPVGTSRVAVDHALEYQEVADLLILDSVTPDINGIGASGATHDWNISREIVEKTRIPVILAGGLKPDNVAEAIRVVQPWGVDSLSHTNKALPGGGFCKDMAQIEAFVEAARA